MTAPLTPNHTEVGGPPHFTFMMDGESTWKPECDIVAKADGHAHQKNREVAEIAAMREPTDKMHTAGQEFICEALEQGEVATVTDMWRRMNGEALK